MSAVIRWCASKPGRLLCSRRKARIIRPAPTRSTMDSPTSATSSAARPRPPPADPAAAALLQHLDEVHARGAQGGHEAEDQARADREQQREAEHARLDVDVAQQFGEAGRHDQREQAGSPEGERQARAASDEREQQVLGEELRRSGAGAPRRPRPAGPVPSAAPRPPPAAGWPRSRTRSTAQSSPLPPGR